MKTILIKDIVIEDRQRKDYGDLDDLANSIEAVGLIHPIVVHHDPATLTVRLIAGGRRLAALELLEVTELTHGATCDKLRPGFVFQSEMTPDMLFEIELEENIRRKDMTWQERVCNIKKVHDLKWSRNAIEGKSWGHRQTGSLFNIAVGNVQYTLQLATRVMADPTGPVATAGTVTDAIRLMLQEKEDASAREEASRTMAAAKQTKRPEVKATSTVDGVDLPFVDTGLLEEGTPTATPAVEVKTFPLSQMVIHMDALKYMTACAPATYDHIITDLPYGIDMAMLDSQNPHGGMCAIDRIEETHDVKQNEELFAAFIPLAFKVIKDTGFFVTWCDIMQWQRLYDLGVAAGFRVQRWPITWGKMHQCMNQCAQYNFTKNTEIAIVMRKPGATLMKNAPSCIVNASNTSAIKNMAHPFVKPPEVWEFLARHITVPGQLILEPCAGVGSGTLAMLKMGLRVHSCEIDEKHYNNLVLNVRDFFKANNPNCTFS